MRKFTFKERLRYAFDRTLSTGPIGLIGWLAVVTVIVVIAMTVVVYVAGISLIDSPVDQVWSYLMLALDTDDLLSDPWSLRLATTVVVFLSMFVTSALIGLISAGIDSRLVELRKGRSRVVESGHTVILGWAAKIMPILSELVVANENQPNARIAILAPMDKVAMEDQIRARIGDTGNTRIICRTGSPMDMTSLDLMSLGRAKSVIVLSPDTDDPDSAVIKTLLAITNNPARSAEPYHIVAAIRRPRNMEVARLAGGDEVELVLTGDVIARIAAQTCRQSGLPVVYTELLNFAGDEIYFQLEPGLAGKSFGEALLAYEDSTVIGMCPRGGSPTIKPPMDTVFREGDQVIAISEDDDTVVLSGLTDLGISEDAIRVPRRVEAVPEHVLILGWNWRGPFVIGQLDRYVAPGSQVTVVADLGDPEADIERYCRLIKRQTISVRRGETTNRRVLDGLPFGSFNHVILLAYSDVLDPHDADARTLITLLHLRDIADHAEHSFSIVSEMMDSRNTDLARAARADDFIVSDRVVSLILSHISEHRGLGPVLASLFDPSGSEIYLRDAEDYVALNEPLNFYTVVEAARRRREVALGYRIHEHAGDPVRQYGVILNPSKSSSITFRQRDRVIVLAEE
jgi:voltage-gated potassium channel Kch